MRVNESRYWIHNLRTRKDTISRRPAVVLKDANDAITVYGLKGDIIAWNIAAEKMYGVTEAETLKMNISRITPGDK